MTRELTHRFLMLRRNHPAWLLLASRNGPLIVAVLKPLIEANPGGVEFESAVEQLAASLADHANDPEFDLGDDLPLTARRELRQWVRRGLVVEREGQLLATDALQRSFHFIDSLEDRGMTSTASRLATVQRAIENLHAQLTASQSGREQALREKIASLEEELRAVGAGDFEVLDGPQAEEEIREVYQLATSLQADFRRVEDSYREADRKLRQRIVSEKRHRGEIVDELLSGHDALVQTAEGQVFESFYSQLMRSAQLDEMKSRLRAILENKNAEAALRRKQKADLRLLVSRLVQESQRVIQARARSERDVRGFLKSGLADEHLRVGALLQEIFSEALGVNWQSQTVRRTAAPLPPVAIAAPNLPLVERFLVKQFDEGDAVDLDLVISAAEPGELDAEFWQAYHALDRAALFDATVARLQTAGKPLTIGELAKVLPPTHQLETLTYWLTMARAAGIAVGADFEQIDLLDEQQGWTRYYVPDVKVDPLAVGGLASGDLE